MSPLDQQLEQGLCEHRQASGWCVAFSGGLDSTVLLHALVRHQRRQGGPPLRAIHIHHGLQAVADSWPEHCRAVCSALDVPLQVLHVQVAQEASIEQAAREARYAAFAGNLQQGELLLVAQHLDDQAETLLLRLLRGSGVSGLQGMPAVRPLGQARLLRPLLGVPRSLLEAYAAEHGLYWIEDPSNQADGHDRNFLRNRVMPLLRQRWPALDDVLQRTGRHMREAQQLLDELAMQDLQAARLEPRPAWLPLECLDLQQLRQLSAARQINLLRHWLRDRTALPDSAHWQGWHALRDAAVDGQPLWQLQQGALVRHARRLYWLPGHWQQPPPEPEIVVAEAGSHSLPGNGILQLAGTPVQPLQVRYRQGGERLELPGRGRRDLKRLLQEQQVPVFLRNRLPLLFMGDRLLLVAGIPELTAADAASLQATWQPPD